MVPRAHMGISIIFFRYDTDLFIIEHCQKEREEERERERSK